MGLWHLNGSSGVALKSMATKTGGVWIQVDTQGLTPPFFLALFFITALYIM